MDPPRIKPYKRADKKHNKGGRMGGFNAAFYCSVAILTLVSSGALLYAYVLQVRYKSQKFRYETPFFHKRDDAAGNETPIN